MMVAAVLLSLSLTLLAPPKAGPDRLKPSPVMIDIEIDKFAKTIKRTFTMQLGGVKTSDPDGISASICAAGAAADNGTRKPSPTDCAILQICVPLSQTTTLPPKEASPELSWEMLIDGKTFIEFYVTKVRKDAMLAPVAEAIRLPTAYYSPSVGLFIYRTAIGDTRLESTALPRDAAGQQLALIEDDTVTVGIALSRATVTEIGRSKSVEIKLTLTANEKTAGSENTTRKSRDYATATLSAKQLTQLRDFAKIMEQGK